MEPVHQHEVAMKRKRHFDGDDELDWAQSGARQFKRTNLTQLPIRTSPTFSTDRTWLSLANPCQAPLTPVDSSDDEACGQAGNNWLTRKAKADTRPSASSYQTVTAVDVEAMEDEMDLGLTHSPIPKRNFPSSSCQINLLAAAGASSDQRAPTPICAKFNFFETSPKNHARHMVRQPLHSSDVVEESYLPSPMEPSDLYIITDPETMMRMEHASSGFRALSVECGDDEMMEDTIQEEEAAKARVAEVAKKSRGRNARLHMGYLADCEKCQQRVPGHYSHILWAD